jgi:hypothetical protein
METSSPPPQAIDPSTPNYYQLVYTLTGLLPPPLEDTPEALRARNNAAVAKVAAPPPGQRQRSRPRRPMHRRSGPGRGPVAPGPPERRRHPADDAAERPIQLDGANLAVSACPPDAGAGVTPEAGGDRRRGDRGRVGPACGRAIYAEGGRGGRRTAGGRVAPSGAKRDAGGVWGPKSRGQRLTRRDKFSGCGF